MEEDVGGWPENDQFEVHQLQDREDLKSAMETRTMLQEDLHRSTVDRNTYENQHMSLFQGVTSKIE